MPTPESKQDVKRLPGMVNFLQKFAPNPSEATGSSSKKRTSSCGTKKFKVDVLNGSSNWLQHLQYLSTLNPKQTLNFSLMHLTKVLVHASCKVASQWAMLQEQ